MENTLSTTAGPERNHLTGAARYVVVGVDASATSRRAAERAAHIATALDAELRLVTCSKPSMSVDVQVGSDRFASDWISEAEALLTDVMGALRCENVSSAVGEGDPAAVLCEEAERLGAELIVVGNRRVQGVSRVLGSVAASVTRQADCDVLVVNTTS